MSVQREYTVRKAEIKDDQQMICTYFSSENEWCTKGLIGGINPLGKTFKLHVLFPVSRGTRGGSATQKSSTLGLLHHNPGSTNTEKQRY